MKSYYQLEGKEVLQQLGSSAQGLKKENIDKLQERFGKNILKESSPKTRLSIFISQFKDLMILILLLAAAVSFIVGEHTDAIVILAIILANAWMGYSQEYDAEQSVKMLQKLSAPFAMVRRDGQYLRVESANLLPGDVLILQAGDIVPADARILTLNALKLDESSLTGESQTTEKKQEPLNEDNLVPGDQLNMLFKGTIVTNGNAEAVITAIGMDTQLGRIAGMLEVSSQKTPLQKRLLVFSRQLAVLVILICLLVFGVGIWRGEPAFQMFLTSLSLAVAALPEALPAVVTIALARGASRLVSQKALMRNLPAVETLGSVTYICTDKTGTLTQNVMTVENHEAAGGQETMLFQAMALSNDIHFTGEQMWGDSTETALVTYAKSKGISVEESQLSLPLLQKLPFDSDRMRMSTLHEMGDQWVLFVKGAPVRMIEVLRDMDKSNQEALLEKNRQWARQGWRVLFFGYRVFDQQPGDLSLEDEKDISYLGMAALIDPPRPEAIEAIRQCRTAGINLVMITGDQPLTAQAIAERLDILRNDDQIKTGADLQKMGPEVFQSSVSDIAVYARVSPEQKLRIVKALQQNGEFVAMTGDGVNDAPSLRQADIGVAMGITGTEVSKEAADMILLDDNFATIVKAVKEGRRIYENIRKFILYVLSCNLGEILTLFTAPLLGLPLPMIPIQILWINLVTDGLPGIALVAEPAEQSIMKQPPHPPKENLFAGGLVPRILITAVVMAGGAIFIQWWTMRQGYDHRVQQTAVFSLLCYVQLVNALSVRSLHESLFSRPLFQNRLMWMAILATVCLQWMIINLPFLQKIFKTAPLSWEINGLLFAIVACSGLVFELMKWIAGKPHRRRNKS